MQCIVGIVLAGRALVSYWLQITNGSFAISFELLSEGRRQEVGPRRGEEEGGHPGPRVVFVKVSGLWTETGANSNPAKSVPTDCSHYTGKTAIRCSHHAHHYHHHSPSHIQPALVQHPCSAISIRLRLQKSGCLNSVYLLPFVLAIGTCRDTRRT